MKSERRHELQQNDLLAWVGGGIEQIKPYLTLITLLAVLVLVAFGGWRWWSGQAATEAAYAWDDLFGAMNSGNPAVVSEVAEQRPNSEVGQWAAVLAADMYLASGCQQLFDSKATAAQDLRKAVDQYLGVLSASRQPVIRERATFALAKAYEALAATRQSEGELEKAVQYYQEVESTWPEGAYAEAARRRIADLQRQETKEFYDKFAQYDPQPDYSGQLPGSPQAPAFDFDSLDSLEEGKVPDLSEAIKVQPGETAQPEAGEPEPVEGPSLGGDSAAMGEDVPAETAKDAAAEPPRDAAAAEPPKDNAAESSNDGVAESPKDMAAEPAANEAPEKPAP